jgi:hypothetical protein
MSEFELNEDRDEFEVLEDFVYNGGNNNNTNNNSKRIVKEVNEAPILKKNTKRRGAEAMYTPIVTFETKSELDNYLKESKDWGYSYTNKGLYGKKAHYVEWLSFISFIHFKINDWRLSSCSCVHILRRITFVLN